MQPLLLRLEYDGTNFAGWQVQPNARTVQGELEAAFLKIYGVPCSVIGAGRTDAGVHARGQVAHVFLKDGANEIPRDKIAKAVNSRLPKDVRLRDAILLKEPVHARFDAVAREYSYTITTEETVFKRHFAWTPRFPFDKRLLKDSAPIFKGYHDFTTFSKFNSETKHYRCNVTDCEWSEPGDNSLVLKIRADRFVYGMVRALTGAMMDAARGRRSLDDLQKSLALKDRSLSSPLAPPEGLVLEKITFPAELNLPF
jgi:tRNA pseudouridine38-40 synthase